MKRLNILVLILLCLSLRLYSQTILLDNKDSLVCFTKGQSKYLLTKYHQLQEANELLNINHEQISILQQVSSLKDEQIEAHKKMFNNCDSIQGITYQKFKIVSKENEKLKKRNTIGRKVMLVQFGIIVIETALLLSIWK